MSSQNPSTNDIARVAYAIWEREGFPEGRDHEHWMRARQMMEEGRAEAEFPAAGEADTGSRPVQPGFEEARPGTVPDMDENAGAELSEEPGGRFAKQIAGLPESAETASDPRDKPAEESPKPSKTERQSRRVKAKSGGAAT